MAFHITSANLGVGTQQIADTSTTQNHPLGTIVQATDPTYGGGEFIYLKGIASTTVGSIVTYNPSTFTTALAPVGTNKPEAVAVAMSANVASQYGWYQISGQAVIAKSSAISLAAGVAVGVKTIGFIASTGSGKEVQGALVAAVASAASGRTTVRVMINRPHMQGRIT
jgi:hypothetical protein